jgi:hypothetical protein
MVGKFIEKKTGVGIREWFEYGLGEQGKAEGDVSTGNKRLDALKDYFFTIKKWMGW